MEQIRVIAEEEWPAIEKEYGHPCSPTCRSLVQLACYILIEETTAKAFSAEEIAGIARFMSSLEALSQAILKLEGMPRGRRWLHNLREWRLDIPYSGDVTDLLCSIRDFISSNPLKKHTKPGPPPDVPQECFDAALYAVFKIEKELHPNRKASFERFYEAISKRLPREARRPRTGQAVLARNRRREKRAASPPEGANKVEGTVDAGAQDDLSWWRTALNSVPPEGNA
jgi:hypothetical protein